AYSTIANLGLIVACGGIGNYEAVWGGILLIIFHAIAKSLLFLSVGTVEHSIGSRDIEDMDGLIVRMPKVGIMMVIGIAGMFLAPFGMLISKWAVLKAFIDSNNIVLVILLVFGSAATLFFWTKWMGKIISVVDGHTPNESHIHKDEWFSLVPLALLTIVVCFIFPTISKTLIEPYLNGVFGPGVLGLSEGNIKIMSMMLGMLVVLPIGMLLVGKNHKIVPVYLGGANVGDNNKFYGTMGRTRDLSLKNYYMENYFGEKKLMLIGTIVTISLLALVFAIIVGGLI
ncbi:MAG: NADH-quinone oxidoreductase subunit L, partial [Vallitaleaceae bacterium]|nr:NADH-quinone oxidoreductase subunit L [Vallitaleaceae bacterium]